MPGTSVPVVITDERQHAWPLQIERDVGILRGLKEKVAGVGAEIAAAAVVGAPHIGPLPDALAGPMIPHAVGIQSDRQDGRVVGFEARLEQ